MNSRVLKNYPNKITQKYNAGKHNGIDIVGSNNGKSVCDYLVAHSDGVVVDTRNDYNKTDKTGHSYGNYVKTQHNNGYYTMYGHIKYNTVKVKKGDKVTKGQVIGYMGNTGHSNGAHLHFEVRNEKDIKLDPTPYINADLPETKETLNPDASEKPQNEPVEPKTFAVGNLVVPTKLVNYKGKKLRQYDKYYTITDLDGDRAVLSANRNGKMVVWAAMNTKNIKLYK